MPFYDLKCRRCGTAFHVMATMEERTDNRIPCPGCGGHELDREYGKMNLSVKSREAARHENCACCPGAAGCPSAKG